MYIVYFRNCHSQNTFKKTYLKKAFDTIDHQIMLQKLRNYGIDQMSLTWFESYLTNRTQKCRVNDQLSNSAPVTCGVPQGSNLGPILFLIYINDLPNCLNHAIPRMFADDTSISYSANTTGELQNVINSELKKLNSWLITNRLSLNIVKTEFMVIGSQQKLRSIDSEINIRINENEITIGLNRWNPWEFILINILLGMIILINYVRKLHLLLVH